MFKKFSVASLMSHRCLMLLFCLGFAGLACADDDVGEIGSGRVAFAQLGQELPDANKIGRAHV